MNLDFLYKDKKFLNFAIKLTGDRYTAEDIIQDVALKLYSTQSYNNIHTVDLHKIAYTSIKNRFYDLRNYSLRFSFEEFLSDDLISSYTSVEKRMIDKERLSEIFSRIKLLPTGQAKMIQLIVDGKDYNYIAKKFNLPLGSVLHMVWKARKFLLGESDYTKNKKTLKENRDNWSNEEKERLKDIYYLGAERVSEIIGRNVTAIYNVASKMGLNIKNTWSKEEDEIIKNNYKNITLKELKQLIPSKTQRAIEARFKKLKIQKQKRWTWKEQDEIEHLSKSKSIKEISNLFNTSEGSIRGILSRAKKRKENSERKF